MATEISITLYAEHEHTFKFPARFAVCWDCEGHGTDRGRNIECDGGGFTASEWDEQDEDFRRDYMAGRYDLPCPTCKGLRVVKEIDTDTIDLVVSKPRRKYLNKLLAFKDRQDREEAEYQAMCRAERRMGA